MFSILLLSIRRRLESKNRLFLLGKEAVTIGKKVAKDRRLYGYVPPPWWQPCTKGSCRCFSKTEAPGTEVVNQWRSYTRANLIRALIFRPPNRSAVGDATEIHRRSCALLSTLTLAPVVRAYPEIPVQLPLNLGELVAEAADGLHIAGVLGVSLYLLANVLDVDIGGARLAEELAAAIEVAHDLLSAVHPPRVGS